MPDEVTEEERPFCPICLRPLPAGADDLCGGDVCPGPDEAAGDAPEPKPPEILQRRRTL
jgi:hypothetical protein